ncbi:MAG: small subunit ribosomal protein S8e [Natronomonas sp.]|jgi:small subunit ribosomal protein S8e|uniref:30S ribosomal protein S8e n=1 Tax=Natronomonas sp. TaxID=2184060 RepID=UPI003988BDBF
MKSHARSAKKRTGGRRRPVRKKRKHEMGSAPTETRLGDAKLKIVETHGGNTKVRAIAQSVANVATDDGVVSADIEDVAENPSNPNYVRRNIITKGAIIETSDGRARVTSRPGQDGQVNAVLLDE